MNIQIENQQKRIKIDKRRIRRQVNELLKLLDCANMEISITFVDDASIRQINKQYLAKDRPTNVISFPLQEGEFSDINPEMLGDIVISVDTAGRDAVRGNLSFEEEILFLIIHGLLHLKGYNHENTSIADAMKMKKKEKELFFTLTQSMKIN
ncbi:MAG: rRNA maturation RNase YbeY [Deltaproteobacteria bacterium HGW-Deltaproteobacteria-1]|jgi:probable rRNA maturation factor|nr:MAG: rRNA maturation RNase YbeY [Deltaproteobacteria bacterium HGW-Deltaproteobacteria-1]